jgi:thiamine-phosphate pyrophosphorylase
MAARTDRQNAGYRQRCRGNTHPLTARDGCGHDQTRIAEHPRPLAPAPRQSTPQAQRVPTGLSTAMLTRIDRVAAIKGLYGIADATAFDGDPVRLAAIYIETGCTVIQLRCKHLSDTDALIAARAIRRLDPHVAFIVNDRPHVAVESGADGVHLGQTDAPTTHVRGIVGPDRLIGRSTNALDQIAHAEDGADYLAFGPVFDTGNISRPKHTMGVERLSTARGLTRLPLVAIGGITADTLDQVVQTGCDSWAVIGAVAAADAPLSAAGLLIRAPLPRPGR